MMPVYEQGDSVSARKAKGHDKIYGYQWHRKWFGRKRCEPVFLPEGLEGRVERCNPAGPDGEITNYDVRFPGWGITLMPALFLTKGAPVEDVEKATKSPTKARGEPSSSS